MNKSIKISIYIILFYVLCKMAFNICVALRYYPVDYFPDKEVVIDISSLYGFPMSGISEYHISAEKDGEVADFQNRDSIIKHKHNSRDIKAYLSNSYKKGEQNKCVAIVNGIRWYYPEIVPNIMSIKCH